MNIQFLNNELFMNCVMIIYDLYNSAEQKLNKIHKRAMHSASLFLNCFAEIKPGDQARTLR